MQNLVAIRWRVWWWSLNMSISGTDPVALAHRDSIPAPIESTFPTVLRWGTLLDSARTTESRLSLAGSCRAVGGMGLVTSRQTSESPGQSMHLTRLGAPERWSLLIAELVRGSEPADHGLVHGGPARPEHTVWTAPGERLLVSGQLVRSQAGPRHPAGPYARCRWSRAHVITYARVCRGRSAILLWATRPP